MENGPMEPDPHKFFQSLNNTQLYTSRSSIKQKTTQRVVFCLESCPTGSVLLFYFLFAPERCHDVPVPVHGAPLPVLFGFPEPPPW
ncbi:MAG: hypothetical protein ACI83D_000461 [Planctomycetota bacterium]|jgi:hypothetical protein